VVDVIRAAVSEVEEYERVDLGALAEATLHGPAVSDVAHLVSELLENATQFSPPETAVRVEGARTGGSYQVVITDRGVGMRTEQLDELNAILRDPPVTGLALGRSLGCLVAARLAARHGITVRLSAAEGEGIAAYVVLPRQLLVDAPAVVATDPAEPAEAPEWSPPPAPEPRPERLEDALPRADFDASLQALLADEVAEPEPEDAEPATLRSVAPASTLTRRVPGATTEALPEPRMEPPVRRSPDEVRNLLARYRSGLEAGRNTDGHTEEGAR
jgi:pimeloyl-ACP methyl ester carboxylesterase